MSATRFDQYDRHQLENKAAEIFRRLRHLNQFPINYVSAYEFMQELIGPELTNAIKTLEASDIKHVLSYAHSFSMTISGHRVQVNDKDSFPAPGGWRNSVPVKDDYPQHQVIQDWVTKCIEIDKDIRRCNRFISHLNNHCSTPGQWNRVFPDFVHFLSTRHRRTVQKMKRKSAIPSGIDEALLASDSEFVASKLALALMLPEDSVRVWPDS